ncbi:formate dehydrogenase accessory protein FdhE [Desulfonatronovibrio magnus]|uniref:formate dehydrogenase accessory protein FdhE n=1 Tax=Desulfonatronovibrio magnus TaxID=698827 RepID=UPI0005EBA336|nr:formate dehydrogenase accessory protein FdhE [Desulfonatronovibrio magnus]RQD64523.1 MAG: formate dehydrogenase accessory protein FdhE [Desulfonatronovibrio sp. MSAO_Bac4]
MYKNKKALQIFSKRKAVMLKKNILPSEMLDLVEFTFKQQLEAFDKAEPNLPDDLNLPPLDQLMAGKPVITRDSFLYDQKNALQLFTTLMDNLKSCPDHLKQARKIIIREMESDPQLREKAFTSYLKADDHFFRSFGQKTPDSPRTLNYLAQSSITPAIARVAQKVMLALPADQTWTSGSCPACGSLPYISNLEGKQGNRVMNCSFCHTSFRFKRMLCPFCLDNKSESFEYFTAKEFPGFRVDVCKSCKMYIKTTDFREMDRKSLPQVDDLESLPLDIMSSKQGYTRPTISVWGF